MASCKFMPVHRIVYSPSYLRDFPTNIWCFLGPCQECLVLEEGPTYVLGSRLKRIYAAIFQWKLEKLVLERVEDDLGPESAARNGPPTSATNNQMHLANDWFGHFHFKNTSNVIEKLGRGKIQKSEIIRSFASVEQAVN